MSDDDQPAEAEALCLPPRTERGGEADDAGGREDQADHRRAEMQRTGEKEEVDRGLELREMDKAEECCGFGGTFSVKFADVSGGMARTKLDSILRTGAHTVVSIDEAV